jgi:predicted membrane protein
METYHRNPDRIHNQGNRVVIGLILVMAGFFLLLRNTNIFPVFIENVIFSWQMLLIAIGLVITIGSSDKTPGIIIMSVGAFFLLPVVFTGIFGKFNLFWPAIFIIAGVIFIAGGRRASRRLFHHDRSTSSDEFIDVVNIFGGGDRQIITENFNGGTITSIFGGSKIDLTKSKLAGGVATLEIVCVFGGTELIVPEDWNVILDITPVLGGFSDERKISSGRVFDQGRQLIIKGTVVFGGGDLKSY